MAQLPSDPTTASQDLELALEELKTAASSFQKRARTNKPELKVPLSPPISRQPTIASNSATIRPAAVKPLFPADSPEIQDQEPERRLGFFRRIWSRLFR